jgi:hypothetical protein
MVEDLLQINGIKIELNRIAIEINKKLSKAVAKALANVADPEVALYIKWKDLDALRQAQGLESLNEEDARFHREFQKSAAFKTMATMKEGFGELVDFLLLANRHQVGA